MTAAFVNRSRRMQPRQNEDEIGDALVHFFKRFVAKIDPMGRWIATSALAE